MTLLFTYGSVRQFFICHNLFYSPTEAIKLDLLIKPVTKIPNSFSKGLYRSIEGGDNKWYKINEIFNERLASLSLKQCQTN